MKKIIFALVFTLFLSSVSDAQTNKHYSKTLKKMFEASGAEESYKAVTVQMFEIFKKNYTNVQEEIWSDMEKEFLKTSLNDMVELLVPVYEKYMTESDLEAFINFTKPM